MTIHVQFRQACITAFLETANHILDQLPPHTTSLLFILASPPPPFIITVAVLLGVIKKASLQSRTLTESKHHITHTRTESDAGAPVWLTGQRLAFPPYITAAYTVTHSGDTNAQTLSKPPHTVSSRSRFRN